MLTGEAFSSQEEDAAVEQAYNWLANQQSTNRSFFLFTRGLLPSYETGTDCFTYDQALACIAFVLKGDFKKASQILDFYNNTYKKQLKKYGKFIGFSDAYKKDGQWGETWAAGPNAWLLVSLNYYNCRTGNGQYLELTKALADWLISLQSIEGGIIGGYYGTGEPMTWISTEHNFDCYTAFRDLGISQNDKRYLEMAKDIKFWLKNAAWNEKQKRFNMGMDNPNYATDLSSWAVLSLGKAYDVTLDFAMEYSLTKKFYKVKSVEVEGFDFGSTYEASHYPDKDAVWFEGTAQMVLAFDRTGQAERKGHFLAELDKAITPSAVYKNSSGLPYASNEGTPAYGSWLMQDKPLCISSTLWYIFAKENFNPFSADQKDEQANDAVDKLDYRPDYQFAPTVDDFEYSVIKFETAYPKPLIEANKAKISRSQDSFAKDGGHSMRIDFEPEPGPSKCSGIINRPFLYPQNWSNYNILALWMYCKSPDIALRIKLKDKEGEPFESRPRYPDEIGWQKLEFNLGEDFVRQSLLPGYGNNNLDREGIRELSFDISTDKAKAKSALLIDEITLK